MKATSHWAGTWSSIPSPVEGVALNNQTIRMIAHASIGGRRLRVRLSNAYGLRKLEIGSARVALRAEGPGIIPASDRPLTFNGSASATIAVGALLVSDEVELDFPPLARMYCAKTMSASSRRNSSCRAQIFPRLPARNARCTSGACWWCRTSSPTPAE